MVRIDGVGVTDKRLKRLQRPGIERVGQAIYAASDYLRQEAHRSIAEGAIQGKGHIPSAPGEPPNWDTGQLATSITNARTGSLKAEVVSNAPYSAALELGTSSVAERPFMRPAALKTRPVAQALVARAIRSVTRK